MDSALPEIQYEVEVGGLGAGWAAERNDELGIEDGVSFVFRLAGKVELSGESRAIGCLDSYVEMTRSSGIDSRHDGLEPVSAGSVGKLVAAQPVAGIVISAAPVGLPKVNEGSLDRLAFGRADIAFKNDSGSLDARFEQRFSLRRARLEKWSRRLRRRDVVGISASRRWLQPDRCRKGIQAASCPIK